MRRTGDADRRERTGGQIVGGMQGIKRLVRVDQKPIGRTPRSNLATYTGIFDHVRKLFAETKTARARHYDAGRFSFNVAKGRCPTCKGEGFVCVELLFLPSVYAPCQTCHGTRYNAKTLEIRYRDKNIADVLGMTVNAALTFFAESHRFSGLSKYCGRLALAICDSANLRLNSPAARRSGSSSRPSCSEYSAGPHSMFSTNQQRDCTRPTSIG